MRVLKSQQTAVHLVTLLEEMPVQETADGIAELRAAKLPVGRVIVNMVRPEMLDEDGLELARAVTRSAVARSLSAAGLGGARRGGHAERLVDPLLRQAEEYAERYALEREQRAVLGELDLPLHELPLLAEGMDLAGPVPARQRTAEAGDRMSADRSHDQGATRRRLTPAPVLDLDPLLDDPATRIVVCCGSGGVGKTTTAAALGLRAAERGRKVVVLTIDPARRLAQSMGIDSLDNTPRRVKGVDGGRRTARDDARHEAHLRRDRRGARGRRPGRRDPGQPLLPVALGGLRGHAGVHGDGEAGPAAGRATSGT